MILFFDRSVGTVVPGLLHRRELRFPVAIEWHERHFAKDALDDQWLPVIGSWGWTVIGHDSSYHLNLSELAAIKQYGIGCFYLWGAEVTRWEKLQCFARAYGRIAEADATTPRPFIYKISQRGTLRAVPIP